MGDVVVVGGGIIGCASRANWRVAAQRADVRGTHDRRRCDAGFGRHPRSLYRGARARALFDLTACGLALYDEFIASVCEAAAVDVEYRRCGTLEIATDDTAANTFANAAAAAGEALQWLDASEARRHEPSLPATIAGALLAPTRLRRRIVAHGRARLGGAASRRDRNRAPHQNIKRVNNRLEVTADDGAKWTARHVVVASGSWAGQT